jgi:predicted metal-dependent hydrolase
MSLVADEVVWGRTAILYRYGYAHRKTLAITVHPDLSVVVSAPQGTRPGLIRARVRKRGPWIRKAWQEFELYLPKQPPRRYVSGETHRYLGRQYRLRVRKSRRKDVKLLRGFLQVLTPAPQDSFNVRRLVTTWYRQHAERVFAERLAACHGRLKVDGVTLPRLKIQRLAKRWGSCSPAGQVILNVELLKAPRDCIDYVITHELCHLRERNHSPRFWRLLDRLMPDWRDRRALLNQMADV